MNTSGDLYKGTNGIITLEYIQEKYGKYEHCNLRIDDNNPEDVIFFVGLTEKLKKFVKWEKESAKKVRLMKLQEIFK